MRCVGVRGDAWSVMLSPCNTHDEVMMTLGNGACKFPAPGIDTTNTCTQLELSMCYTAMAAWECVWGISLLRVGAFPTVVTAD